LSPDQLRFFESRRPSGRLNVDNHQAIALRANSGDKAQNLGHDILFFGNIARLRSMSRPVISLILRPCGESKCSNRDRACSPTVLAEVAMRQSCQPADRSGYDDATRYLYVPPPARPQRPFVGVRGGRCGNQRRIEGQSSAEI